MHLGHGAPKHLARYTCGVVGAQQSPQLGSLACHLVAHLHATLHTLSLALGLALPGYGRGAALYAGALKTLLASKRPLATGFQHLVPQLLQALVARQQPRTFCAIILFI